MLNNEECIWTKEHLDELLRIRSAESAEKRRIRKILKEWEDSSDEIHAKLDALILEANRNREAVRVRDQ
jgi:hypothetical protein